MRTFTKLALFGLAVAGISWWLENRRRRAGVMDDLDSDIYRTSSAGASFGLADDGYDGLADSVARDDLEIAGDLDDLDLDVDATSQVDPLDEDVGMTSRAYVDIDRVYARATNDGADVDGSGELYGMHTPQASDTDLSAEEAEDGFQGAEVGETWFEALEVASAEGGPLPEHEVSIFDENDDVHMVSAAKDTPIADLGSAGRAGL